MTSQVPFDLPGEVRRRHLEVSGAKIAVVEVGGADRPAMVVAHGAGSSARFVCAAFAAAVIASGRRLITYDLRGHGASSPANDLDDHHLDVHVADLIEVVFDIDGEVAIIGGVSLGAHAAVRMVASGALRPSTAVLGCLPAGIGPATPGSGPHAAVAAEIRAVGIGAVVERLHADDSLPDWLRETLVEDYTRHDAASLTAALLALEIGDAPAEEELSSLPVPLAVVGWPDDPGHPREVAERWCRAARSSALGTSRIEDLDGDLGALGRVAVRTVEEAIEPA